MIEPRRHRFADRRRGHRALVMLLSVLLALAPILAPAQSRHAGMTNASMADAPATTPPCHSQSTQQDPAPACPHCDIDRLAGCPCCEYAAPGGLLSSIGDTSPARFAVAYLRASPDELPAAPSEACFRPPIAIPA